MCASLVGKELIKKHEGSSLVHDQKRSVDAVGSADEVAAIVC